MGKSHGGQGSGIKKEKTCLLSPDSWPLEVR